MRCNPTSASALWLFLSSCMARRNGLPAPPAEKIVTALPAGAQDPASAGSSVRF